MLNFKNFGTNIPSDERMFFATVPVGPPNATLKAIVIPPRDYRVKATSKFIETTNRFGLIDHDQLRKKTSTLLHSMHLPGIDPGERLENLSVAHQQMIEISKALAQEPRILILDEPTASLTERKE